MTAPVPIPTRQRSNTLYALTEIVADKADYARFSSYAEDQTHPAAKDQPSTTTVTSPRSASGSWWSSILSSPKTAQTPSHSQASSISSESSGVRTPEDDASPARIRFANDSKAPGEYGELQAFREAGKRRASWAPSGNKPGSPTFFPWLQPQSPGGAAEQSGLLRKMSLGQKQQVRRTDALLDM